MTCPAGCLRAPGHFGFHTTVPAIAFVRAPWLPRNCAIVANQDGSSAVLIAGLGERGEENSIRAGRKMLELIEGLKK